MEKRGKSNTDDLLRPLPATPEAWYQEICALFADTAPVLTANMHFGQIAGAFSAGSMAALKLWRGIAIADSHALSELIDEAVANAIAANPKRYEKRLFMLLACYHLQCHRLKDLVDADAVEQILAYVDCRDLATPR